MLHRLLQSDETLRCKILRHAYERQDNDPLLFECERCGDTWNVRDKVKNPPNHRPNKGVFREGGAPYCEACGKSLNNTGENPKWERITDISRFSYYPQAPDRDKVLLCVGCRHALFALGTETEIKSTLHAIDTGRRPIDFQYGRRAEYGEFAKN